MLSEALKGKKILDFTLLLPGPLATNILAQMGAEIIKIEHPDKLDDTRIYPPFVEGEALLYRLLNHNKESLILDYKSTQNRAKLLALIQEADVIIEQFRPGVMQRWGLDYSTLKTVNPNLIYLSLSGYGQVGAYRLQAGHDINYLAYTGILDLMRDERGKPVIPGIQIADIAGGSYMLVTACLAALVQGKGQYVDVSMLDGLPPLLTIALSQTWGGINPHEMKLLNGNLVNYNVYACKEGGWMALGALEVKFWNRFCEALDQLDWKRQHFGELSIYEFPYAEVKALFLTKTRDEWVKWAEGKDICLSPVLTIEEVEADEHLKAKGYFETQKAIHIPWLKKDES
ncbi:CaiB/BaiF CoA transferase family protein [Aureispira anguillae]|uniref:CoA transferase n=1 Tax=Aureispira anguillae TaxID=2864201 RepID=A0A916DRC0_9BACT|nr:CoA transferase [Aureispira anguillae]BDS10287.1 CoA transferase [Aureispira anguillae]